MQIEGTLEAMNLPTLVQFLAQERSPSLIQLEHNDHIGLLYLDKGQLCHAEMRGTNAPEISIRIGEEVVYELLGWHTGRFKVQKEVKSPQNSIEHSWDFLLMEGLRQLDERQADLAEEHEEESLVDILAGLSESDAAAIQQLVAQQEVKDEMASKREQVQDILNSVVNGSSDINGAVVVDNDGLLLASALSGSQDGNRVAAVTAGLISLAGRSAQQLGQGGVNQTLIQAENGNIVALRVGANAAFVALTPTGVNLGMTFMECREAAGSIAEVIG